MTTTLALSERRPLGLGLLFAFFGFCLALSTSALAQEGAAGTITGRVNNEGTGAYLEGARVTLNPGGRTTLTSREGQFTFAALPPGEYQLSASYTGLESASAALQLRPGQRLVQDIALTSEVYQLGEFTVAGEREGSALAITLQRNAPNVKNVLSSDAFGAIADQNIGNFLQRVPGISTEADEGETYKIIIRGVDADMSSVTIDGTRSADGTTRGGMNRGIEVDKIPADFIESIEVTKAPTPEMDADSIGGTVNLKTKSAFDRKGRVISYMGGSSLNVSRSTFRPIGSFMYSDLLGKDENLGVMFTASYNRTHKPRDSAIVNHEPTTDLDRPTWFWLAFAGEDQLQHVRIGTGLRLDYKLSDDHRVFFNTMYSYYEDRLNRRRFTMQSVTPARIQPNWTDTVTETFNHPIRFQRNIRFRDTTTTNFQVGGDSKFGDATLDYSVNFSDSTGKEHRDVTNRDVAGVGFRLDRSRSPIFPEFTQVSGPDFLDPANSTIPSLFFLDHKKTDRIWGGQVNFRKRMDTLVPTSIKTGLRYRGQNRVYDENREEYRYVGTNIAGFIDETYKHRPVNGLYPTWPFMDLGRVIQDLRTNPDNFVENTLVTTRNSLQNDSEASEDVYAAYAMADAHLGKLSVLGGLRVEETRVRGIGVNQEITPEELARRQAWVGPVTPEETRRRAIAEFGNKRSNSGGYRDVFPSLHFKYDVGNGILARASWSTGIGRPNFGNIVPRTTVSHDNMTVNSNNINLQPQYSDNFDVSFEYYFEPAGMITVGGFLKEVTKFIYSDRGGIIGEGPDNGFDGLYEGYELRSNFNGGYARIRGWEVAYQQQFSHLPGFWRGFGFFGNFTYLESKGDYGQPGAEVSSAELVNFVPHTGNVGISYIDHGWTIRVKANYTGHRLNTFNANPVSRIYRYASRPVDLNLQYRLNPRLSFFMDVINVFDVGTQDLYIYHPTRVRREEKFTTAIKFGINGRL